MKIIHKALTVVTISMTFVLSAIGTPTLAHEGHHGQEDHNMTPVEEQEPSTTNLPVRKNVINLTPYKTLS